MRSTTEKSSQGSSCKRFSCLPMQSLLSIWYGLAVTAWQVCSVQIILVGIQKWIYKPYFILQAYITYYGITKFLEYLNSKFSSGITSWEFNLYIGLQGSTLLLLPLLLFASIFKLGKQKLFIYSATHPFTIYFLALQAI